LAVLLDVVFRRFIAMADSLLRVAMRDERLMRRMRIVLLGVVLRRTAVMQRCLLMVLRCGHVVFRAGEAGENFSHDFL
jgi:hypothetical protein